MPDHGSENLENQEGQDPVEPRSDRSAGSGAGPHTPADVQRDVWRDPVRRLVIVCLVLTFVGAGLSLLSSARATRLSALDEATHIDYAYQAGQFDLVRQGDPLSDYTLQSWACRGQANSRSLPPCGIDAPAGDFPADGEQYNAKHPPLYYGITGVVGRQIAAATGADFVTVARAMGAVWLVAAMIGLYLVLRYWRTDWRFAFAAALSLPLIPVVLHASSTVTNDAPAALAGVAALFVLGRVVVHDRPGWLLPTVLTAAVAATKIINATALVAVALVVIGVGVTRLRGPGRRTAVPLLVTGVGIIGATAVVHFTWSLISDAREVPNWVSPIRGTNTDPVQGWPLDEWAASMFRGFRLTASYYLDPVVNSNLLTGWNAAVGVLLAASSLLGLAVFRRCSPGWLLAMTVLVGSVGYPLAAQIQTFLQEQQYFPNLSTRYGMSLIPLALAMLALIAQRRRLARTTVALLATGLVVVLLSTAGWLGPTTEPFPGLRLG